ncbi:MAG: glycosyltransferase, partial [Pyrinomonadaceae bacterium]|nr:glycosyltransferase [Pyrinomonadaceae bacterium]
LTVLVEDYFHVGAFGNLIQERNWSNFETRYEQNTLKMLKLLDEYDTKATFFVLGWIAEQNPGFVAEIAKRGHEVASRGYYHRSLGQLTNREIRKDLKRSKEVLEAASGQKIVGFRAAEKLSYEDDMRVLRILAEEGYSYDASFLPTKSSERLKRFAHQFHHAGNAIWEFPYSTRDLFAGLLPISGGNYLRQIPYTLMRYAVRDWTRRYDEPFVFYVHVWELDPEQPRISAASSYNRVRHYRKLDKMEWVLQENLGLYNYTSVADFLNIAKDLKVSLSVEKEADSTEHTEERSPRTDALEPVTIAIPCYNEADSLNYLSNILKSVEEKLAETGYKPEIIFIDDGSLDGTSAKLEEKFGALKNVSILQHEKNMGVAAAIMTGIRAAKTEVVCSMDCDCTYDPHGLAEMIPLLGDEVDMVTASPYHPKGEVRNVPSWRLTLSKGASFLYRRVLGSELSTYTSCFRVYRRSSVAGIKLKEKGFLGVAELLGKLLSTDGKIVEYPATLEVRLFGFSKMKTLRTIKGHLRLLAGLSRDRFLRKNKAIATSIKEESIKKAKTKISGE